MTETQSSTNPFQAWTDTFSKWSEGFKQSWQAPAINPMQMFNPMQTLNPFQQMFQGQASTPPDFAQQLFQQYLSFWTDFWNRNAGSSDSSDPFKAAERQWMEQLQNASSTFSKMMRAEEFAKVLGKSVEQTLAAEDKFAKAINPKIDSALRMVNLPSRGQIDRLLQRVIGLEEQLDEIEQVMRQHNKVHHNGAISASQTQPTEEPAPRKAGLSKKRAAAGA